MTFLRADVASEEAAGREHFRSFVGEREVFSTIRQQARSQKSANTRAANKTTEDARYQPPAATSSSGFFIHHRLHGLGAAPKVLFA